MALALGTALSVLIMVHASAAPEQGASAGIGATLRQPRLVSTLAASPRIFVTNPCSNEVTAYPVGSMGDVAPLSQVTGLASPSGIAVDASGKIYVANTGCVSVTVYGPGSSGAMAPVATISGPHTGLTSPAGVALDTNGNIYVANTDLRVFADGSKFPPSVTVYAAGSTGDAKPIATISGPDTGLDFPGGIALDSKANIYVANLFGTVTVYAAGSNGDAAPIATISGARTGLDGPAAVALDSRGNIYVANTGEPFRRGGSRGSITTYAPGSSGNVNPIATIAGFNTGLDGPAGVALDSKGNIYVTNVTTPTFGPGAITVYRSGSRGNAIPAATIVGSKTGLESGNDPFGITVDKSGNIYVADGGGNRVTMYSSGSHGNASPAATLGDPSTGLHSPDGIALDGKGNIYVANHDFRFDTITTYAPGSNAATAPIATIGGSKTGLNVPAGIALDSKGNIYVANMGIIALTADHADAIRSPSSVRVDSSASRYARGGSGSNRLDTSSVTVYSPGSTGNVKPIATISGSKTGLRLSTGIAVDSGGNIYVANSQFSSTAPGKVTVYAPGSKGNVSPIAAIAGSDTGLDVPVGLALDSQGNIYVANLANTVTVYAPGSNGDAKPRATIAGPDTGLNNPSGIALDSTGDIYVTNSIHFSPPPTNAVTVYAPGSTGDAAPIATISGGNTGLAEPLSVAVGP